jgi:DNA-directed RNA polymerase specialized sigma24 family protein
VIDLLRKWKREEAVLTAEKQKKVAETKNGYSDGLGNGDCLKEYVVQAVNSLIESRRKVVRLHLLGMNIEEISAFYGWSHDKTRNLLYRGLTDIKKLLKKKDIHYDNK